MYKEYAAVWIRAVLPISKPGMHIHICKRLTDYLYASVLIW